MFDDKRVAPRFSFSEPVSYIRPEISFNGSIAGNISLSGISLRSMEFIPVGAVLELQLRLGPSPKVVLAKARVVRVREVLSEDCFEMGLQFDKDPECEKAVGEFINNQRRS